MVQVIRYAWIYLHLKNCYSLCSSKQSETNSRPAGTSLLLECICLFIHSFVVPVSHRSVHPTILQTLKLLLLDSLDNDSNAFSKSLWAKAGSNLDMLLVHHWTMTDTLNLVNISITWCECLGTVGRKLEYLATNQADAGRTCKLLAGRLSICEYSCHSFTCIQWNIFWFFCFCGCSTYGCIPLTQFINNNWCSWPNKTLMQFLWILSRKKKTPNESGLLHRSGVVLPQCEGEILAILLLQLHLYQAKIGETSGPSLAWRYHHQACLCMSTHHYCQHLPLLFISKLFFFPTASSPIWYLFCLILTFQTPTVHDPSLLPLIHPAPLMLPWLIAKPEKILSQRLHTLTHSPHHLATRSSLPRIDYPTFQGDNQWAWPDFETWWLRACV